jgi:hypothetical protein
MLICLFQNLSYNGVSKWREKSFSGRRIAKRCYVHQLLTEDSIRDNDGRLKICYNFPEDTTLSGKLESCCAAGFGKLYGMSSKTRVDIAKMVLERAIVVDDEISEMRTAKGEGRRHNTLLWFREEFSVLCDFLPTSEYTNKDHHLPRCVSKKSLFFEYRVHFAELFKEYGPDHKPYSRTVWLLLWKEHYSYVTIPKCFAFSVCSTCANLQDRILSATKSKDKSVLVQLKQLRRIHLGFISKERLQYRENQRLAREYPDKYISICVDGMDQAKLRSPHFAGGGIPKSAYTLS